MTTPELDDHRRPTYEDIHVMIGNAAKKIVEEFKPDLMVAIGGGGFFPARVLRTFLKRRDEKTGKQRNLPIQAIGLSLYEQVDGMSEEMIGTQVVRTQWLEFGAPKASGAGDEVAARYGKDSGGLVGNNVLIVDEVDDSRTTLHYAYNELLKDVRATLDSIPADVRADLPPTRFAIFVVQNKLGPKRAELPIYNSPADEKIVDGVADGVYYYAGETTPPVWIDYPWEMQDITEHNRLSALAKARNQQAN
ncbi:hypothetical protein MCUN1_000156 [Malassezia cuniculi]|uniref:PRTase-like protein n=1 Tax=Malassezia cuniculi TaxID=948313 RepID=A0AAF0J4M2_9BASI|nr:hypothetical protein MCUN1_000156 [Malassezia cuniculi]